MKNYTINFETETIIITKKFAEAAQVLASREAKELKALRTEYPSYKIEYKTINKKENKKSYKGLTLAAMKDYLGTREDSKEALEEYKRVIEMTKEKHKEKGKYAIVKKWFLDKYREDYEKFSITDLVKTVA